MAANTLLTIAMISQAAARTLVNSLGFSKCVNRTYDSYFAKKGAQIGASLNIRKPSRFTTTTGAALNIQDTVEQYVTVTLAQKHVATAFTSFEETLSLQDYENSVLVPAMASIANQIDYDGLQYALQVGNVVGTPGTPPATVDNVMEAQQCLDEQAAPDDGLRSLILAPVANRKVVQGLSGLFNDQGEVARQYKSGRMKNALGFDFAMDQNVPSVTVAAHGGSPVVNTSTGITSGTATIAITGASTGITPWIKAGEAFTVAGVFRANPQNRTSTGTLQTFTALADTNSDGSGNLTVSVAPTPVTSGAFQNVAIVGAGATKGVVFATGTTSAAVYSNNVAFHRDAFVLATADLILPKAGVVEAHTVVRDGIAVRTIKAYDVINDRSIIRFDVCYGWAVLYQELACRITN